MANLAQALSRCLGDPTVGWSTYAVIDPTVTLVEALWPLPTILRITATNYYEPISIRSDGIATAFVS